LFRILVVIVLMVPILSNCGALLCADDWPTHLHDNQRTGISPEALSMPLAKRWQIELAPPESAWPEPATQDYWNRKTNLQPRIVHDRAHGLVVADGKVVISSSTDDQVRAFDTRTGEELWTVFAEGPIRLAPSIWQDKVLFGADDGCVYSADLSSGDLLWKTAATEQPDRRIPGNGRIINERPVRSGVLVDESGTGFLAAGIFPEQGAYFVSLNAATGEILDRKAIPKSVQGYLEFRDGRVFAPTGRDRKGIYLTGSADKPPRRVLRKPGTFSQISDANYVFHGRDGLIVATTPTGREVWKASVRGRVYSMAISDGQLFASTDAGVIYAFAKADASSDDAKTATVADNSKPATRLTVSPHGYMLLVDPDWDTLRGSVGNARLRTIVAVDNAERATELRQQLAALDFDPRCAVHQVASFQKLPYADRIFQRVVGGSLQDVRHLVRPGGGVAICKDGQVRPALADDEGSWTHAYGDPGNLTSSSTRVGTDLQLQWFGGPGPRNMVDRHMRTMPPLVSDGYMYIPGLDRIIVVDAFSGSIVWEKELPGATRIGMLKDCGWMVAANNELLVAVGDKCQGFVTDEVGQPVATKSISVPLPDREWGYLVRVNDTIVGSSTLVGAARRTVNRDAILEGAYSDNRPLVCSDALFAFDANSGSAPDWIYESSGAILNPTIATGDGTVFFLENGMGSIEDLPAGRMLLVDFLRTDARLTAIDLKTGKRRWQTAIGEIDRAQNAYVLCDSDRVVLVNSRNTDTVHYDVRVFDTVTGEELWTATQDNLRKTGGDHGEQDKHPLLTGSRLIVEPYAYDIDTGHRLTELDLGKRGYGCGTISASADALFFRSGTPARYRLDTNEIEPITSVSRTGCWINMIPAAGMLLIPEGSSGCTCDYAIQTSMAFAPRTNRTKDDSTEPTPTSDASSRE